MTASEANRSGEPLLEEEASVRVLSSEQALAGPAIFNDGKAPDALRTIGEVTKALGIRQHVLRYWEEQFPALQPIKRSGNRRYYRPEDVALIGQIDRLVNREGYTLRGARMALEGADPLDVAGANQPADAAPPSNGEPDIITQELVRIRDRLAQALAAA